MIINQEVITELRKEFGDAFYLLDSEQFRNNFLELKEAFSSIYSSFNIAYSYKTNYTPKLCKIVNELGGYAETVSEMEVELALKCGVNPKNIIWNGPIKNHEKLEEYLSLGVTVNIDSIDEAEYIELLADKSDVVFNVGIRCNYDVKDEIVIVEDGLLTNELENKVKYYENKYEKIFKIVRNSENHGLGFALNCGLKECRNEIVARMDTDDISVINRCDIELKYLPYMRMVPS